MNKDGSLGNTSGEFSVRQFFDNDSSRYVRRYVNAEEAGEAFQHYCSSAAARMGMTIRVIITDGGDCTNAEWIFGKGITFPTPEAAAKC